MNVPLAPKPGAVALDPLSLIRQASGVVLVVLVLLVLASFAVWMIWFLKSMQLRRLQAAQDRFERDASGVAEAVFELPGLAATSDISRCSHPAATSAGRARNS